MSLDIESLVSPLSDDAPSGPDLYGDLKRQQIEQAFDRSISGGEANEITAAQWQDTIDLIIEQCGTTRDLWLPVYLMRAASQAGQFDLVVESVQFLARLIDVRWADVHPQLEDLGYIGRKTPCESLTRIGDFLGPLEKMPLVSHPRLGSFSGADFDLFRDKRGKAQGYNEFSVAIEAIGAEALSATVGQIDAVIEAIRSVDGTLTANADGDTATNFKPTYDLLAKMRKAVSAFLPKDDAAGPSTEAAAAEAGGDMASGAGGPGFSGGISSRNDVSRAIDAICDYYARHEPASPVPFVLRRAKEWISLDFMAVLQDIAPGSLGEATLVLGANAGPAVAETNWENSGSAEEQNSDWSESTTDDGWS